MKKDNKWIIWLVFASLIIGLLGSYWGDNWFGILSSVTGAMCVILTAKGYRSAFIVGIINCVTYATIAYGAKYYGDFMLNAFYYLPMQLIGWKVWSKNRNITGEIKARSLTTTQSIKLIVVSVTAIIVYAIILNMLHGSLPIVDSTSTVLSVIAMMLSVKMYKEQWLLWIVINIVSIAMWVVSIQSGGTDYATLIMWCVYLANSVWGYVHWTKLEKKGAVI